jgi:hypothetical protein
MRGVATFRVYRDTDRTRIDVDDDLLGWGVRFPSGACYVEWRRASFPEGDRLDHPHVSRYGSVDDVEQGTGGVVRELSLDHDRPDAAPEVDA